MLSFVLSGLGCAFAGLCYAEFAAMIPLAGSAYTYAYATLGEMFAWIIGWDLTLEYAMGASTVSSGWSNHFIELLNIFHIKMPLWLAYDHWTALKTAENIVARQMAQALGFHAGAGHAGISRQGERDCRRAIAGIGAAGARPAGCSAPVWNEIGFNLPAFIIALVITAILVVGIKESARFNATIVDHQGCGRAVRDRPGCPLHQHRQLGNGLAVPRANGFSGIGAGAAYIFLPTSDSTRFRRPRRRPRIRSATCRSA